MTSEGNGPCTTVSVMVLRSVRKGSRTCTLMFAQYNSCFPGEAVLLPSERVVSCETVCWRPWNRAEQQRGENDVGSDATLNLRDDSLWWDSSDY